MANIFRSLVVWCLALGAAWGFGAPSIWAKPQSGGEKKNDAPKDVDDADDPFSLKNMIPDSPDSKSLGSKELEGKLDEILKLLENKHKGRPKLEKPRNFKDMIRFEVALSAKQVRRGDTVKVTIHGVPAKDCYTYPFTRRTKTTDKTGANRLSPSPWGPFRPVWPTLTEDAGEFKKEFDGTERLVFNEPFNVSINVFVTTEATPGKSTLKFDVLGQVCDKSACYQMKYPLESELEISSEPPIKPSDSLVNQLKVKEVEVEVVSSPDAPENSLWGFVLFSMGAAFLMLLTPCVFPMIPITVSFFLKQSEKEHHNALVSAGTYCLTIIIVLAAAVFALGQVIVELANNPWINLALGAVLIFFALSLFGMYEIELPSGLARFTSKYESKGGAIGAFFMALTFTITSFTCTGPFLGPLLVATKEVKVTTEMRIFGALAYAATFAAPFFVLALFPKLIKKLPKSGGWLNLVKVVMGFLELAAALKFLANTDLALNPGDPILFNYDSVLCSWIALSAACGLYLFGVFRMPHDSPVEHLSVPRMLFASIFLGFAVYMIPALWRVTPQGVIGKGLVAFLPLDTREEMDWSRDYEEAYKEALENDQLLFVDFTGVNCTNCRYNEKNVFTQAGVKKEFDNFRLVQLYTDTVPTKGLSAGEAKAQAERNMGWQSATFEDITNPFYAIIKPDRNKPAIEIDPNDPEKQKLNGTIVGLRKGLIPANKVKEFEKMLRKAREQFDGERGAGK